VTIPQSARYLWTAPWTALGMTGALVAVATGGSARWRNGIIEASGGIFRWLLPRIGPQGGIVAITIGHAVVATDRRSLDRTRDHERVHVRQFERWGPFFPALYGVASLLAILRGGDGYLDNHFEREARRLTS